MDQVKVLIFDADDTLWKNNLYYETARSEFIELCQIHSRDKKSFDRIFDDIEWKVVQERGYGSTNFIFILDTLFHRFEFLADSPAAGTAYRTILDKFVQVTSRPPELFEGVRETLERLAESYTLAVLTKGDPEEQNRKLRDSGIGQIFQKTFVVPEKNLDVYHKILREQQWEPDQVCMIGNSPKSDINPALLAGLWAVYIPYPYTWKLDDEPLMHPHPRLKEISRLLELGSCFPATGQII